MYGFTHLIQIAGNNLVALYKGSHIFQIAKKKLFLHSVSTIVARDLCE